MALGVFSWRSGRLHLQQHVAATLSGAGASEDAWLDQVGAAFRELRPRLQRPRPCVLVLPGHLVLTKFLRLPRLAPAQREKIIRFESEQSLPVALNDLVWDSAITAELKTGLEVMLVAAHRAKVEALCAAAQAAGFEPRLVLPATLATLAAFRLGHGQPPQPAVVINVGARSTIVLLVDAGRFLSRTLAFGVERPASDCPGNDAEKAATRLAQELTRSLLFFRQQGDVAEPSQVYLGGGGGQLTNLDRVLAAKLNLPVVRFDLSAALETVSDPSSAPGMEHQPMLIELAGAAAARLRGGQVLLNLLPSRRRHQTGARRRRVAFACVLLLLAAVAIHSLRRGAAKEARPAEVVVQALPPPVTAPVAMIDSPPTEPPTPPEDAVAGFDAELIAVKAGAEPYRLQLVGYVGGPGDYVAAFVSPGQPETLLARTGRHFEQLGLTLASFEVKKMVVAHDDASPAYDLAGVAVLRDEKTGQNVVLDSRSRKFTDTPQATLRFPAGEGQPRIFDEGDTFTDETATYRIERIQLDPPEVVVAKQTPGLPLPETRVLRPVGGDAGIANQVAAPKTFPAPAKTALATNRP